MLTRVDRVQVVVGDRVAVSAACEQLLGARVVREDNVRALGARRTVLQLGTSEVELLEPDGTGEVAEFLARTRGGLFAAGFATGDFDRLRAHVQARGVPFVEEGQQLFLSAPAPGLRAVVSPDAARTPTGLVRRLYEVTTLVHDFAASTSQVAAVFGLDAAHFVPIRSDEFGYEGVLTLFDPDRLDRVEVITPTDAAKTMGRFFAKRGPCLYMCYAEADDPAAIRARLLERAAADWTGDRNAAVPHNLFIHPNALGGMMMGVSRTTFAWTWSGHPERVAGVEGS